MLRRANGCGSEHKNVSHKSISAGLLTLGITSTFPQGLHRLASLSGASDLGPAARYQAEARWIVLLSSGKLGSFFRSSICDVSCSVKRRCDNPRISIPIWRGIKRIGYDASTKIGTLFKEFLCSRSSEEKLLYCHSGVPATCGMSWYRRLQLL